RRELGRGPVGCTGPEHEGTGHETDDECGATTVADRLGIDGSQAHETRPRPRSVPSNHPGQDRGAHRGALPSGPYWARKTSSRFGSRLTTSTRPCPAAAAMTAP